MSYLIQIADPNLEKHLPEGSDREQSDNQALTVKVWAQIMNKIFAKIQASRSLYKIPKTTINLLILSNKSIKALFWKNLAKIFKILRLKLSQTQ